LEINQGYSKKMFTRRAQPILIIGDPNNQGPDMWISTVTEIPSASLSTRKLLSHRGKKCGSWELGIYSDPCGIWGTMLV
jgi:hypothetical protein